MTPKTSKEKQSRIKWLVRVTLVNNSEQYFTLSTKDIRKFIVDTDLKAEKSSSSAGIINKYVFPYIFKRFENQPFKAIKVRGNYG